ncbi:MAG: hypothetical protein AB1722_08300 [Pseudomonadota bacterium]
MVTMKSWRDYRMQLFFGLFLNVVLMVYVYFVVDGGPASMRDGNWLSILNEMPSTALFFLAAILKPYLMVWWKCRPHTATFAMAGNVMLLTTLLACLVVSLSANPLANDLAMYINWALLWGASTYFVLVP